MNTGVICGWIFILLLVFCLLDVIFDWGGAPHRRK